MPKGEQRGNREAKKPKKEKPKTIAAAPSMKGTAGSSGGSKTDRANAGQHAGDQPRSQNRRAHHDPSAHNKWHRACGTLNEV